MDPRVVQVLADDWPETAILRTFTVANPAVATDWTFTVPGESVLGVFTISARLVTDGNAANRIPVLRVTDGATALFRVGVGAALTATTTTDLSWLPEIGYRDTATNANTQMIGLPPLYMAAGAQIIVATTALQVGDQWSNITVSAYEVFHGHREHERAIEDRIVDRAEAIAGLIGGTL